MEKPLNDIKIYPSNDVLLKNLGRAKNAWDKFLDLLKKDPLVTSEWRYYQDGKTWLFKVIRLKKTLLWVSVWDKYFKVTSYFSSKIEELIISSDLDEQDKKQYIENTRDLRNKSITINSKTLKDVKRIEKVLELKKSLK